MGMWYGHGGLMGMWWWRGGGGTNGRGMGKAFLSNAGWGRA